MNFHQFKKTTGAGGDALARAAWDHAVALIKAALPAHADAIDAALAHDPELEPKEAPAPGDEEATTKVQATDSGTAAEGSN